MRASFAEGAGVLPGAYSPSASSRPPRVSEPLPVDYSPVPQGAPPSRSMRTPSPRTRWSAWARRALATARGLLAASWTEDVGGTASMLRRCQSAPLFDDALTLMTTMLAAVDSLIDYPWLKMHQAMAVMI